jgi:hypothetical protein
MQNNSDNHINNKKNISLTRITIKDFLDTKSQIEPTKIKSKPHFLFFLKLSQIYYLHPFMADVLFFAAVYANKTWPRNIRQEVSLIIKFI